MAEIVKLVPRAAGIDESGNGTGSVSEWLRTIAELIDKGEFGSVGAAVIVVREDAIGEDGRQFCLRTRRCNMNFVEQLGALNLMHHDMLHAGFDG